METVKDILAYIPQRPPFVMVDTITNANEQEIETTFTILPDNIFVSNGRFTEPGLVENMAQSIAAGAGYEAASKGEKPKIGYIGALKKLQIAELPMAGSTITTRIALLQKIMNAQIAEGKVFTENKEIASCELRIFIEP